MKTQQEIELLAEKTYFNVDGFEEEVSESKRHWVGGYTQCQEDIKKELYEFGKLVLDTFHSEGKTHSGKARLARIKYHEWFNEL